MPDADLRKVEAAPSPAPLGAEPLDLPDYTLLRRIGRGSYGDVWLARSITGVFRVIKIVQRARFEDDRPYLRELEGISRFQAAVSGRPRQLALLHVGRNDEAGYFYYVMEPADDVETGSAIDPDRYVPLTLREMVKRRGRLPAAECIQFALELARGLAVLHGENLIHRDIKPSNVIFVQRVPKLADVGLVASVDATLTGVGTPGYLPPEGPGSAAADIYSLGKLLYEIATGLDQSQYPRIPRELADHPDAPLLREINGVILKACSPYPAQRHPSVEALARDLEIIQAGRSVVFYEEFRRRSRAILLVTGTFGVLAGLAVGLLVWRSEVLKRANRQSQRALYRSDLAIAQLAKASGDLGRARSALARQIPAPGEEDLRGLEWAILAQAVRGEGAPLENIPNPVAISKVAVDPSGRWVAAAFNDDRVGVWDLRNGHIARVIENAQILGGFLPDGRIVVDEPNRAIRYERPEAQLSSRWETGYRLRGILPDGRSLAVSSEGDYVYKFFNYLDRSEQTIFNLSRLYPHSEVSGVAINNIGTAIAIGLYTESGAVRERRVVSYDVVNRKEKWSITVADRLGWIIASPDQRHFLANIGWLRPVIMDYSSPSPLHTLVGHEARINDAAYSIDGSVIATASADQTIRTWRTGDGKQISIHQGMDSAPSAVAWLPNGRHLVVGDEGGQIRVFTTPPTRPKELLDGMFSDLHGDIAYSPNERLLAVSKSTNSIAILSTSSLELQTTVHGVFQPIAFSGDEQSLYGFDSDWTLYQANIFSSRLSRMGDPLPPDFSVISWAISSDSSRMAISGENGALSQITLTNGISQITYDPDKRRVWGITFTEDSSELWTGNAGGVVRRWTAGNATMPIKVCQTDREIQAIAVSPDRKRLVVSFYGSSGIRILDLESMTWTTPRHMHRRYVQVLFFTDRGQRLVSGGVDGRVVVWRVPEFEEITTFEITDRPNPFGDEGIATLRLSPKRSFLSALTEDGHLQIWRTR